MKIDQKKCYFCGTCSGICPNNAIEVNKDSIFLDPKLCTNCRKCISFCPVGAISE